jgi:hypothetical protein
MPLMQSSLSRRPGSSQGVHRKWKAVTVERGRAAAYCCSPNGARIAAYFFASFIEGSGQLGECEYFELRKDELKLLRAYSADEIDGIDDRVVPQIYKEYQRACASEPRSRWRWLGERRDQPDERAA